MSDVNEFLANRFGARMVSILSDVHMREEQRPIETRWDVVTAGTAYAKGFRNMDARVAFEMDASKLLVAA